MSKQTKALLTKDQALLLVHMHEIDTLLRNEEEVELLEENHPELLEAYRVLVKMGKGK